METARHELRKHRPRWDAGPGHAPSEYEHRYNKVVSARKDFATVNKPFNKLLAVVNPPPEARKLIATHKFLARMFRSAVEDKPLSQEAQANAIKKREIAAAKLKVMAPEYLHLFREVCEAEEHMGELSWMQNYSRSNDEHQKWKSMKKECKEKKWTEDKIQIEYDQVNAVTSLLDQSTTASRPVSRSHDQDRPPSTDRSRSWNPPGMRVHDSGRKVRAQSHHR